MNQGCNRTYSTVLVLEYINLGLILFPPNCEAVVKKTQTYCINIVSKHQLKCDAPMSRMSKLHSLMFISIMKINDCN